MYIRRPNAFLIGAAKCGTTALASYLAGHPQIFFTNPKEPNYFNTDHDVRYRILYGADETHQSEDGYLSLFEAATRSQSVLMEGSVWYLYSRVAVGKILDFNPEARFVVMLRNPVDMVFSLHGQLYWSFCEEESDFDTAWNLQFARKRGRNIPRLCLEPSLLFYKEVCSLGSQMEALYRQVDTDRILPVLFDDFVNSPSMIYERVLHFLNIPSDNRGDFSRVNQNKRHRIRALGRAVMREGKFPWLKPLVWKFNISYGRRGPMKEDSRRYLTVAFREEVDRLEAVLERNLDIWRGTQG